jgi:hypothetical protein
LVCTQTFLNYIQEDSLSIEVWGHKKPIDNNNDEEEEDENNHQQIHDYLNNICEQKRKTLQERWQEVTKRLGII